MASSWGDPHAWLVDPNLRNFYTCDSGLAEVSSLRIPDLDKELRPDQIFD
jgi:hypothetical protein